jgi:EAL and modified HD-GYP domain-containing signal transduction protein
MSQSDFLVRTALLDPARKVVAHQFQWQRQAPGMPDDALALALAAGLHDEDKGWLLADGHLILPATPAALSALIATPLPPSAVTLSYAAAALAGQQAQAGAAELRRKGYGLALRDADAGGIDAALCAQATQLELDGAAPELAARLKRVAAMRRPATRIALSGIGIWAHYDTCAKAGLHVYADRLLRAPAPPQDARGLNASQTVILQLMDLVNRNADLRELEAVLKRDPAISYKLFRYINSVGFGLGAEIHSIRHAVTMLGYSTLYRWLSLLLATASGSEYAAPLMKTAIIRGRFAELLGASLLPKSEAENLFVAGMFSVLDRLLGQTMEEVLSQIPLSEALCEALLSRSGIYGPFLALAESCEQADGGSAALADALFLDADQVNRAHLAALAWAQNLKL